LGGKPTDSQTHVVLPAPKKTRCQKKIVANKDDYTKLSRHGQSYDRNLYETVLLHPLVAGHLMLVINIHSKMITK
jgi:hypothetical protein